MVNGISPDMVKARIKEINSETPVIWTNLIKSPQELSVRTTARNNIMLDTVIANQNVIYKNQAQIIENQTKILQGQEKILQAVSNDKKLDVQV